MPDHRTPTRRQLLAVAGTALVAAVPGCAESGRGRADNSRDRTGGDAADDTIDGTSDTALAQRAAGEAAELLAAYRATLRRHGELTRVLRPLAAHHGEHLAVLTAQDPPRIQAVPVPGPPLQALAALRQREQAVERSRGAAAIDAASGDLARILASVAACQAQHVQILNQLLDARVRGTRS